MSGGAYQYPDQWSLDAAIDHVSEWEGMGASLRDAGHLDAADAITTMHAKIRAWEKEWALWQTVHAGILSALDRLDTGDDADPAGNLTAAVEAWRQRPVHIDDLEPHSAADRVGYDIKGYRNRATGEVRGLPVYAIVTTGLVSAWSAATPK